MEIQNVFSADKPITSYEEDKLQRSQFARQIAHSIINRQNTDGLVMGLYGAWGEGKSSVLNLIEQEIKIQKDQNDLKIALFKFNPWRYSSEDMLLRRFFSGLALSLKSFVEDERLKNGLHDIGEIYAGRDVDFNTDKRSEEELQVMINSILVEQNIRVIVFMDDIDRLDKNEVYSLFRLVKLNANFSNTTYLLAFDQHVVADALGERFGAGSRQAGLDFIEKIVQVPLILPKLTKGTLLRYCLESIKTLFDEELRRIDEHDWNSFEFSFELTFENQLTTQRLVLRFINTLIISVPLMRGEVRPAHLILFEAIKMFFPDVYNRLAKLTFEEVQSTIRNYNWDAKEDEVEGFWHSIPNMNDVDKRRLNYLFEKVFIYQKPKEDGEFLWFADFDINKDKITPYDYWRLVSLIIPNDQVSNKELHDLLTKTIGLNLSEIIDIIDDLYDRDKFDDLKNKFFFEKEDNEKYYTIYDLNSKNLYYARIKMKITIFIWFLINNETYDYQGFKAVGEYNVDLLEKAVTFKKCKDILVNVLVYEPAEKYLPSEAENVWLRISTKKKDFNDNTIIYGNSSIEDKISERIQADGLDFYGMSDEAKKNGLNDPAYRLGFDKALRAFSTYENGRQIITDKQYRLIYQYKGDFFNKYSTLLSKKEDFFDAKRPKKTNVYSQWRKECIVPIEYAEVWSKVDKQAFFEYVRSILRDDIIMIWYIISSVEIFYQKEETPLDIAKFKWFKKVYEVELLYKYAKHFIEKVGIKSYMRKPRNMSKEKFSEQVRRSEYGLRRFIDRYEAEAKGNISKIE